MRNLALCLLALTATFPAFADSPPECHSSQAQRALPQAVPPGALAAINWDGGHLRVERTADYFIYSTVLTEEDVRLDVYTGAAPPGGDPALRGAWVDGRAQASGILPLEAGDYVTVIVSNESGMTELATEPQLLVRQMSRCSGLGQPDPQR